jgi:hypothetical protein
MAQKATLTHKARDLWKSGWEHTWLSSIWNIPYRCGLSQTVFTYAFSSPFTWQEHLFFHLYLLSPVHPCEVT